MRRNFQKQVTFFVIAFMLILIGFVAGTLVFDIIARDDTPQYSSQPIVIDAPAAAPVSLTQNEQNFADIYQQVGPAVVSINVVRRNVGTTAFSDEVFGSGSGFVIDTDGHIMTNFHVVQDATEIEVNFLDGTIVRADAIGLDPDSDLAVLRVDLPADRLVPVEFADIDELVVGQTVLAIGSPFGQRWTLTSGIISALDRTIQGLGMGNYRIGSAIQTDASINPGNSGGPLLNLQGEVVGVNSQIISRVQANVGIGFAIPSDLVERVANDLITTGSVSYSFLGIEGSDVSLPVMEALNLPNNQQGIVVGRATPNGPAALAGLRNMEVNESSQIASERLIAADIIVAINGEPVTGFSSLIAYLARHTRPGDTVQLTVLRNGEQVVIPVTLSARPSIQ